MFLTPFNSPTIITSYMLYENKHFLIISVLLGLMVFAGTTTPTHANNFYGIQPLKPMVERNKTTIHLPGGAKLATESDETEYFLTDHLQSTRLVVAGNNSVSKPTDYTSFGDTPANTTEIANQYTGMTYEPETATYDYHARAYDPGVARFTGLDRQREDASPYVYVGNNPIAFVDPSGGGRVPFILLSGFVTTGATKFNSQEYKLSLELYNKEISGLVGEPYVSSIKIFDAKAFLSYKQKKDGTQDTSKTFRIAKSVLEADSEGSFSSKLFWVVTDKEPSGIGPINLAKSQLDNMRSITKRDDFARDAVIIDFSGDGTAHVPIKEQLKNLNGKDPVVLKVKVSKLPMHRSNSLHVEGYGMTSAENFAKNIERIKSQSVTLELGRLIGSIRTTPPITQAGGASVVRPPVTRLTSTTVSPTITWSVAGPSQLGVHGIGPMRHQNTLSVHRRGTFYQRPGTNLPQTQAQTTESSVIHTYFPPGF